VLTARAENHVHGGTDLTDTISRLQSYQEAGADVLFAPGLRELDQIRAVVSSVDRPVNVLVLPGMPSIGELADAGVSRISVGGGFAYAALGALLSAGRELLSDGTYGYWETAAGGAKAAHEAFKR
jgi:2-methylisocitrate lyase-like PEP mutase family enzyme